MSTYPYSSGQSAVVQTFAQLRKGFPAKVDAGYLQRFSIAPANESYVISILRFLGLIDEEGNRSEASTNYFYGGDDVFEPGLEQTLRDTYSPLFDEVGDDVLTAERYVLTNWFRASDKTSALVGQRQANTFLTLAALAGYGEVPTVRTLSAKKAAATGATAKRTAAKKSTPLKADAKIAPPSPPGDDQQLRNPPEVGLTVRIEVNLPPDGDAATYDSIFASIKKHLMS